MRLRLLRRDGEADDSALACASGPSLDLTEPY
jgi:hypothetical protein